MPRYKRTADEAQLDVPITPEVAPENIETLQKLRNMWEFASLMQYIFLFGHIIKIDDSLDIEDLEAECLKPEPSPKLARIGLQLLKYVSSHRGLTPDIFDEYTRRQYVAKAPYRNPFGEDEDPVPFNSLDVFDRVHVLQQLSIWTLGNAERMRGMMPQDEDHLNWRMEPLGWDREDNAYYVLDDNRLYRRSDEPVQPPTPPPKPKAKTKAKSKKSSRSKATRSSKRRKVEDTEDEEPAEEVDVDAEAGAQDDMVMTNGEQAHPEVTEEEPGYGFTDKTWSLVAITLEEYDDFLSSIFRSRDPNEKKLHKRVTDDVRPIIERREEALRQKQLRKLRELENLQKVATAKRSSRLAGKAEKEKEEREKREAEEKRDQELRMAHEEEERQRRIEEGHDSRRQTREQRLKEREVKRILHEEELKKLQEAEERAASASQEPASEDKDAEADRKRASARQAQTQKEQHKQQLARLAAEETGDGKWYFDCSACGMHGENLDDGTHSLACDKCGVWQHSKCHGFTPKQAEKNGFTFICKSCKRQEAMKDKPKIPPLKLGKKASASPASPQDQMVKRESNGGGSRPSTATTNANTQAAASRDSGLPHHVQRQLDGAYIPTQPRPSPGPFGQLIKGPSLSPLGQAQGPPGYRYPPVSNFAPNAQAPQQPWHDSPFPPPPRPFSSGYAGSPPPRHMQNGGRPAAAAPSPGYTVGSPPAQHMPNGHRPPQPPHHQQHQYVHQQAVAAAGAHPGYVPPPPQYQQQANGHDPRSPSAGHYQMAQQPLYPPTPQHGQQQYYQQAPPMLQQQQGSAGHRQTYRQHQQQQQYGPPVQPLMNGFQSPVKAAARPSRSPQPPPAVVQSSPALQPTPSMHGRPAPNLMVTPQPQGHRPSSSNGIAADGMSGPWPAGSKAIPQKHDVPPSSSPMVGTEKVVPPPGPMAALAPSPRAHGDGQVNGPSVIPVKKDMPEMANGTPSEVPAVQTVPSGAGGEQHQ